ncbi:succinate dehydrogenase assembly factor 4, mitochondrial isoform X1 [Falco rusticolus]|uniref:succinate dehydrogenase assembly factor 4, mitochondrial isoform X1 n=1 Tax=Falco rusticolus TaxID=120794 RepID=UPI0018866B2C|nr:succinate dehydrogenase assembly factor 4, mitochondrial isoform X1 [Falco rusticolus]XP_055568950.1 succinate dehydrogenase assembly factor 4, mitochondrial isoform X1 [Falco cherrug]
MGPFRGKLQCMQGMQTPLLQAGVRGGYSLLPELLRGGGGAVSGTLAATVARRAEEPALGAAALPGAAFPAPPRLGAVGACACAGRGCGLGAAMALRLLRCAPRAAKSSLLCSSQRSTSSKTGGRSEPAKQSLKKPKLPLGRFDEPEESNIEREPLEKFPDGINPVTKERGGPKGPEPTRFGDWERKGRCIDF